MEIGRDVNLTRGRLGRKLADDFDHFVGLLDEMADQTVMGLLGIPRAVGSEPTADLYEPGPAHHARVDKDAGAGPHVHMIELAERNLLTAKLELPTREVRVVDGWISNRHARVAPSTRIVR